MSLLDRRFLFVVGKGGVGKSAVATSIALAAASQGKRTLLAMVECKERVSDFLEVPAIGSQIAKNVRPNLDAVTLVPEVALEEYGMMVLKVRALYKLIFENRLVRAFLDGVPGIASWSMLGKAFFHASPPSGAPAYDLVVVDAQATGHSLEMLRVPVVIQKVAPPGLLRKEADRALEMFRNSSESGMVLVTLPEDMPTNETLELHAALTAELSLPIGALVVNRVLPELVHPHEAESFEALPSRLGPDSPAADLAQAARARSLRERVQRESLQRLSTIRAPRIELRDFISPELGPSEIEAMSKAFATF
jgi:anion-transporting  ArsA/GET3 family ATPase